MVDDDARDERLGEWLEPEPLDDVTRRRLVSTAMRESRESRAARWIATAAAIVVVLVVGLALLTARGGNDEREAATPALTPTNERASTPSTTTPLSAQSAAPQAAGSATADAAAPVDVGDFGDLDRAANRARLRTALENLASALTSGKATTDAASELAARPCRNQLPAGTVVAVGAGTLDGRAAVVVFTDLGDGSRSMDAVLTGPCEVRSLS